MTSSTNPKPDYLDYLCIDVFLENYISAQALQGALALGLVDTLKVEAQDLATICCQLNVNEQNINTVLGLLQSSGVIIKLGNQFGLSEEFKKALIYLDLIEAKLEFANILSPDLSDLSKFFFSNTQAFMQRAKTFELFDYQRCFENTKKNFEDTWRWMKLTTAYTKYESAACLALHDFSQYQSLMDIGGNSGEFCLRICKEHTQLLATVVDLPVVCELGKQHVGKEVEAQRINFVKANALVDELPIEFDAVSFKSILHDWPEEEVKQFIAQAHRSLKSGGEIVIFERSPIPLNEGPLGYSHIPIFMFTHFFRNPDIYRSYLQDGGFNNIKIQQFELELPFSIISAKKS